MLGGLGAISVAAGGPATTSAVDYLLGVVGVFVRLGKAGDPLAAVSRCLACPLACAVSAGILFYALLLAVVACID